MKSTASILFILATVFVQNSFSVEKIPLCNGRASTIKGDHPIGFKDLANKLLVGHEARISLLTKNGDRIDAEQSFADFKFRFLCSSLSLAERQSWSFEVPTLIDRSTDKKTGDYFWTFHTFSSAQKLGSWNRRSRLYSNKSVESWLKKEPLNVSWFTLGRDQVILSYWLIQNDTRIEVQVVYDISD